MSLAAVALARGVNATLLRRWVREAEVSAGGQALGQGGTRHRRIRPGSACGRPGPNLPADIRIELRRGATTITVTWPLSAAAECAPWMRELLR